MSIPLPNLDTKTFAQLMEEAKALIPRFSRNWTDFNPSDPGITLLELFAWINEMIIYRQNQLSLKTKWQLLKLLVPPRETASIEMRFETDTELTVPAGFQIGYKKGDDVIYFENPKTVIFEGNRNITFYNISGYLGIPDSNDDKRFVLELSPRTSAEKSKNQHIPLIFSENHISEYYYRDKPLVYNYELYDIANTYGTYNKPDLLVNGVIWEFRPDLAGAGEANVFSIDYHLRELVFGDGKNGNIPDENASLEIVNLSFSNGADAHISQHISHIHSSDGSPNSPWVLSDSKVTVEDPPQYDNEKISEAFRYNITPSLGGKNWYTGENGQILINGLDDNAILQEGIRDSLAFHRSQSRRVVIEEDFIAAVKEAWIPVEKNASPSVLTGTYSIDRVWCLENYNIDYTPDPNLTEEQEISALEKASKNHLSVLLGCKADIISADQILEDQMKSSVLTVLEKRRQITTQIHVGIPVIKTVNIDIVLSIKHEFALNESTISAKITQSLKEYFDIIHGGADGRGWMPGEGLYESELYTVLERMEEVDMVQSVMTEPSSLRSIKPNELIQIGNISISINS